MKTLNILGLHIYTQTRYSYRYACIYISTIFLFWNPNSTCHIGSFLFVNESNVHDQSLLMLLLW